MSIEEKILEMLNTQTGRYKGVPLNCFLLPVFNPYHKQSVRNTFSKLNKGKFILKQNSRYLITDSGIKRLHRKKTLKCFDSPLRDSKNKNLLVLFDIPEERKTEREWFRKHLRKFGYIMIQRSVWVGPSPLPKEFVEYISKIKLKDSIKTFKLAKSYL